MFKLNQPLGTNYRAEPDDILNTKRALSRLGHYPVPPERGIDDWADTPLFDGIRTFQKAHNLKVDGFMRPGGPTETAMNQQLADNGPSPQSTPDHRPTGRGGIPQTPFWQNPFRWYLDATRNEEMRKMREREKRLRDLRLPPDDSGTRG